MNLEGTISRDNVYYWSEEDGKMAWMREKRIKLFMQIQLDNCRNELVWLRRCNNCAVGNYPEEKCSPRPLPISTDFIDYLQRRLGKATNGIIPPTLEMILKTYYPLPVRQAPVHLQKQEVSLYYRRREDRGGLNSPRQDTPCSVAG